MRASAPSSAKRSTRHSAPRRSPSGREGRWIDSSSSSEPRRRLRSGAVIHCRTLQKPRTIGQVPGGGSITLFHVRGIRIAVDWSWFLILFLVIFWMSNFYSDLLGESAASSTPFILAVASAAGFFGSILLHELGHAWVARRNGIGISSIQLWIFGGMARMDREADSPGIEARVALGGPAGPLAVCLVCAVV